MITPEMIAALESARAALKHEADIYSATMTRETGSGSIRHMGLDAHVTLADAVLAVAQTLLEVGEVHDKIAEIDRTWATVRSSSDVHDVEQKKPARGEIGSIVDGNLYNDLADYRKIVRGFSERGLLDYNQIEDQFGSGIANQVFSLIDELSRAGVEANGKIEDLTDRLALAQAKVEPAYAPEVADEALRSGRALQARLEALSLAGYRIQKEIAGWYFLCRGEEDPRAAGRSFWSSMEEAVLDAEASHRAAVRAHSPSLTDWAKSDGGKTPESLSHQLPKFHYNLDTVDLGNVRAGDKMVLTAGNFTAVVIVQSIGRAA